MTLGEIFLYALALEGAWHYALEALRLVRFALRRQGYARLESWAALGLAALFVLSPLGGPWAGDLWTSIVFALALARALALVRLVFAFLRMAARARIGRGVT